ncbi:Autophagy-related protein 9A [Sarcoptes scabiei]|uniref:Autophagy-related protein 9 n=1 Tax=Sarcoptes scabiei TaxID=52283 RepID=A0A834VGB0_SARSC|nr:Autophagy-related protein 9A [Sarcoptes scabiei]
MSDPATIAHTFNRPTKFFHQPNLASHYQQELGSINRTSSYSVDRNPTTTSKHLLNKQSQSNYQSFADLTDPSQEPHLIIHVAPGQKVYRPWQSYISDLDDFFERIYCYYRKSGFVCIVVGNILELIEIILVVSFTFFFVNLVNYDVLFKRKLPEDKNHNPLKVTIYDCIIPFDQITLNSLQVILLVFAICFWFIKLGFAIFSIISNYAIRSFFVEALQIYDVTLYSWQEIQDRLITAQSQCLLRESHLDELSIHNRLLRRDNYMIALVNRRVLPIWFDLPFLGECVYLTSGMEFNLNILLFRGVLSLFDKNWKLRDKIKQTNQRLECARRFSNRCLAIGVINFLLLPMILLWQSLYAFYTYVEAMKRDPTMFGSRTWSRYGRWFCRHFNELDHELEHRLNRAHRPATRYMNAFITPLLELFARFITFTAGILLSVLIVLTIYDEDVITVEHVLTLITVLGASIAIARAFMADVEPNRWSFGELDAAILQHIHYRPHNHPAHTAQARNAMANLFVYKSTTIIEELISPLLVPYILIKHMRARSLDIIDFFRVYTLELADIGDVCTFSQLNLQQHGHRFFTQKPKTSKSTIQTTSQHEQTAADEVFENEDDGATRDGKLELSLINFKIQNPKWQPHASQEEFIDHFTRKSRETSVMKNTEFQNEIGESKSTIDLQSPTMSTINLNPTNRNQEISLYQSQKSDAMRASHFSDSNDRSMIHSDRAIDFGHSRRRMLCLYYPSMLSEQEERERQMALSSLYFHEMISDSLNKSNLTSEDNEIMNHQSQRQSMQSSRRQNESLPLLRSSQNFARHNRLNDDDLDDSP